MKFKALFYSFETILNSYESKYKTRFPNNHLFQTVCLAVVLTSPSYILYSLFLTTRIVGTELQQYCCSYYFKFVLDLSRSSYEKCNYIGISIILIEIYLSINYGCIEGDGQILIFAIIMSQEKKTLCID